MHHLRYHLGIEHFSRPTPALREKSRSSLVRFSSAPLRVAEPEWQAQEYTCSFHNYLANFKV
jgi:hypothetical protein